MNYSVVTGYIKGFFSGGKKEVSISKVQYKGNNGQVLNCFGPGIEICPADGENLIITPVNNSGSFIVSIGGINQNISPDTARGERRIYSVSSDGAEIKAIAKFKNDGTIELNEATSFAVKYDELVTALNTFKTAINSELALKLDGAGSAGTVTIDISSAKSDKVKLS